ncbi:unnamed protein product [Brachionus calyciflorus]|uniref:Uncharacterized protein n=1 Tax=Brachionus calyciflorus TaxID=104777 RepID=A0A814CCI5_9BILA|nr:unnamed protein product [Brachionus calyciflorus]
MEDNRQAISDNFCQLVQKDYIAPKVFVEPCQVEFFYEKFKQCYPMYKNPRGQCLIINIYQITGMPPRRWSDRDTDALKQLFEQLLFNVNVYTDSTHDLSIQNLKQIIKNFADMKEHEEAQSCVICLMSHGEEGYLTTKEGDKILLDEVFTMFNNLNCPNLAGKPKLFFIQSCRDDPVNGPAEDLGIRLSFSLGDEKDGNDSHQYTQSDNNSHFKPQKYQNITSNNSQIFYHIPSQCDMLIGYPTQKGFIAYRKPEIGSWYMNAIVQIFSKYAHNTDLCAMLNMVNSLISNEVTNTGKKQMSEYTSKLTKPYFYFFPGLASDPLEQTEFLEEKKKFDSLNQIDNLIPNKRKRVCLDVGFDNEYYLCDSNRVAADQTDSNIENLNRNSQRNKIIDFIGQRAVGYWKHIAREMDMNENQIVSIERNFDYERKIRIVVDLWLKRNENLIGKQEDNVLKLAKILSNCKLNKIKNELLELFSV